MTVEEACDEDKCIKLINEIISEEKNNIITEEEERKKVFDKSDAFLSRNIIIYIPDYNCKEYLGFKLMPKDNYEKILYNIFPNDLIENREEILNLKSQFEKDNILSNLNSLNYIRWFQTVKNIHKSINENKKAYKNDINYKHIIGNACLRSILDKYNSKDRKKIIKNILKII